MATASASPVGHDSVGHATSGDCPGNATSGAENTSPRVHVRSVAHGGPLRSVCAASVDPALPIVPSSPEGASGRFNR